MESDSIVKTNLLVTGTSVQTWVTVHSVTSNRSAMYRNHALA